MRPAHESRRGVKEGGLEESGGRPKGRVMVGRTWEMATGIGRAWEEGTVGKALTVSIS